SADFEEERPLLRFQFPQSYRKQYLIRLHHRLTIARVKIIGTDSPDASNTPDLDLRIESQQHRETVAGGGGVGDVAADGAAGLNLNRANGPGRFYQRRGAQLNQWRSYQLRVSGQRPDANRFAFIVDTAQLIQTPDVDELFGGERFRIKRNHQVRAAGDYLCPTPAFGEKLVDFFKVGRRNA